MQTLEASARKSLSPETQAFCQQFSKLLADCAALNLDEARTLCRDYFMNAQPPLEPIAKIDNVSIPGPDENLIPIRLITPEGTGPFPVIAFFHRGGWVFGSIDESESLCRKIANRTQCIVAIVGYRHSPENKYPKPLLDCYKATQWLAQNAQNFNGIPHKIAVSGESAGGNLAASCALMARDKSQHHIAYQLLICPILTAHLNPKVYQECPDQDFLTLPAMKMFWSLYLENEEQGHHPYASPLFARDFHHLPQTLMITAEFDPLKHEGQQYVDRLKEAHITTSHRQYSNALHGFLDLPIPNHTDKALNEICREVHRSLKALLA